jgi:xanthine dehydrogenase YagR molybdenum-binding subunit
VSEAYTGKPLDRVDGRLKVTGKAIYSSDVPVANVAHAVIVGSTISRGRIASIETREAERVPGVLAVLTHANAPKLPNASRKEPNERVLQLLQDDEVRYDGQPIAVVIADTLEQAQHAASLVRVRYDAVEPELDLERARSKAFVPKPSGPRGPPDSARGDADAAFAVAPVRVDETYRTPVHTHNPMEPHATVAVWQGPERLTLYDATQGITNVQKRASALFGIPRENVRVISRFLGGGFGCKGSPWSHVMLAAMAARATQRAVKLVITRPQMFEFVGYRPVTVQQVALGARRDGVLVAMRHEVLSQTSRFDEFMEPAAYGTRMLYACDNVKTSHRLVRLDVSTPTFTRAPGEASGSFALECALDELAYALKMDPIELRLKNHADRDPDEKKPWSSKTLKACYREGAEKFGWSRRRAEPRSMRDGPVLVGLGMATATYPSRQSPCSALARLSADGTALVLVGTQDIGTGTYTIMTQVAADALGMPIEQVRFDLGDTKYPEAPLSAGSQTASSAGSAVRMAALALRDELARLAVADARSRLHGLAPGDLDAEGGRLVARGDRSRSDAYAEVVKRSGQQAVEVRYDGAEKLDRKSFSCHSFGAQFAEVGVDEDLGIVRVRRLVGAFAAGKFLNRKTGANQLMGGMVWGIGLALEEHTERDPRTGRIVTKDLADYHVPVNADVPRLDVIMIDEEDPHVNDVGAKGIGEIGLVGAGAAIANAVYHATGKRIRDLPITVDKLI